MGKKVSVAAYARHRGVSRQAVYKALDGKRITRGADGKIDVDQADLEWDRNTAGTPNHEAAAPAPPKRSRKRKRAAKPRPTRKGPRKKARPAGPDPDEGEPGDDSRSDDARGEDDDGPLPDLRTARAVKEHYLSLIRKLEFRLKAGQVVETAAAANEQFRAARLVRDRVIAVADRLADELAAETDASTVHRLLLDELRRALESAAEAVQAGEDAEAA